MNEELTGAQKRELLSIARAAVRRTVLENAPPPPEAGDPALGKKRGAFVTMKVDGKLRGCIGHPLPVLPLAKAVVEAAEAAASEDFRFEPLRPAELDRLRIEISVLGLPERIRDPRAVEVGRHGIIVSKGPRRGLLLPQVPVEQGWDLEAFLSHGCLKAGLDRDEWKRGADIDVFTAQVFSEEVGTATGGGRD